LQQVESETKKIPSGSIRAFEYQACPGAPPLPEWTDWAIDADAAPGDFTASARDAATSAIESQVQIEFETRLAEEKRRAFEAGCEQGRAIEREAHASQQDAAEQQRVRRAAELFASFAEERDHFLSAVEHEVVKLALAVAARIVRREAQMDPLLLTGAVRVALGQLSGTTKVRLRVPAAELELWTEAISLMPNLAIKPVVSAGDEMHLGDCRIETEVGSVDLGIRSQLGEIERGFFDRAGTSRTQGHCSAANDISDIAAAEEVESRE
jgi:flagellar assembly protein FliH